MESRTEFIHRLKGMRSYLSWHDGILLLQRSAWLASLAVLLCLLLVRLFPIEGGNRWAILPVLIWLIWIAVQMVIHPKSLVQTAVRIDLRLNLKESLSSSLLLHPGGTGSGDSVHYRESFIEQVYRNADEVIKDVDVSRSFPLRLQKKNILSALLIVLLCVVLLAIPNPMDAVLAERKALREEAQRQAEKIEVLKEEIENSEKIDEKEKEELLQQLSELAEKLRANDGDRQQALADIANLEKELGERLDATDPLQQAALESLTARLQNLSVLNENETGNEEAITDAFEELAQLAASADQENRETAAREMAEMSSRASQAGNSSLAQALAALSDALKQGDSQAAAKAAASASQAVSQMQKNHALQSALSSSLSQCQNSRQALSQKSGDQASSAGKSQGQSGGGGGGTKANSMPPSTSGAAQVQSPRGIRSSDDADVLSQEIYAPRVQGETTGEELQIQGQDSGMGQEEVSDVPNPMVGQDNPALVPYRQVYGQYVDAANEAMDASYIPADLKEYVRSYFSLLEP